MANSNSTPPLIAPEDVRELVLGYGPRRVAQACGVGIKQVRRWMSGASRIPLSAYRLLRILGERDLGEIDPTWRGWQLWPDHLHTPEGQAIKGAEFRAAPYEISAARQRVFTATEQAAQALAERDELRAELKRIKDARPPRKPCVGSSARKQISARPAGTEKPSKWKPLDPDARETILKFYEDVLAADLDGDHSTVEEVKNEIRLKKHAILTGDLEAMGLLGIVGLKRDYIHLVWG